LAIYPLLLSLIGLGFAVTSFIKREKPYLVATLSVVGNLVPGGYWVWWLAFANPITRLI
jgi:hypothetical protein